MTQHLLALCRRHAVPVPPGCTQHVSAGVSTLAGAGACQYTTRLLPRESMTAARTTREQAS
ncbi:MAG TPA: hypothetical protein VGI58_08570 [Streptosporangiaceae bacterium]|jgi:hypothetical protein